jgi:hypothetical protein
MKKLIAAAVLIASTAAVAQNQVVELLRPSPWTIGIVLGKWMVKDHKKIFYVEVTAQASNLESARESAFRMAVERAMGTVISSEKEVQNSQLQRNEIISYASGYVDDYQLVQQQTLDNQTQVQMKVWVSHSALRDRLLNVSKTAGTIEGGRLSEQIHSIQRERDSGDRILATVLADYPQRAFDVLVEPTRVTLDANRRAQLHIPFWLKWNEHYLQSLKTAVTTINQRQGCDAWLAKCRVASKIEVAGVAGYFDDTRAYEMADREMVFSRPQVQITLRDTNNAVRFRQCFSVQELDYSTTASWHYVEIGGMTASINPARTRRHTAVVDLESLPKHALDQVEITLIRGNRC